MENMQPTLGQKIMPFLILGISLAVLVVAVIFIFYVVVWGLVIGLILFGVAWVKEKFFPQKASVNVAKESFGRTIEHDDK